MVADFRPGHRAFVRRDTHLHPDVRLASPMEELTAFRPLPYEILR